MNESPSQYLKKRFDKISAPVKAAVISAFIIGIIAHIASITGFILNWDVLIDGRENSYWFVITQGKWLFPVVRYISKAISIGSVAGVLSVVLISLSAGLVVSILAIKKNIYAGLTGAVMVLFPTVMCTFFYEEEDIFFTSLFLSVLAVYIVKNFKFGYIWGTLVLTLSLGTYQAYIDVAATMFLLICLCELLNNQTELKKTLLKGLKNGVASIQETV